jgi:hypothetical protein
MKLWTLTALDGKVITRRTGSHTVTGLVEKLPEVTRTFIIIYSGHTCSSPGTSMWVRDLEIVYNGYIITDEGFRKYKLSPKVKEYRNL